MLPQSLAVLVAALMGCFFDEDLCPSIDARKLWVATGTNYTGMLWGLFEHVPATQDLVVFSFEGAPVCHELISAPSMAASRRWSFAPPGSSTGGLARPDEVFAVARAGPAVEFIPAP